MVLITECVKQDRMGGMCSCLSLQLKDLGKDGVGGQSSSDADQCGMTVKAMPPKAVASICPCLPLQRAVSWE